MRNTSSLSRFASLTVVAKLIDGAETESLSSPNGEKTMDNRRKSRLLLKLYDA